MTAVNLILKDLHGLLSGKVLEKALGRIPGKCKALPNTVWTCPSQIGVQPRTLILHDLTLSLCKGSLSKSQGFFTGVSNKAYPVLIKPVAKKSSYFQNLEGQWST